MKTRLLFLSTILFSFSISAQIDFETHTIVDSHPDVSGPYTLVSADIDGDGDKDIVATSTNGDKVVWMENIDGQGNFSEPKIISSSFDYPLSIAVNDIDGDGDLDVISASTYDDKIAWFENTDGLGNFGPLNFITTLEYAQTVQAKDMDGDGDIDIIAGGDFKIIWLENVDGLGAFAPEKLVSNNIDTTEAIDVNDIDGDGDMDVAMADWLNNVIAWFENIDGQGTFGPAKVVTFNAHGATTVITKDIDNDGDIDVVAMSGMDSIAWFENIDGLGNFSAPKIIASNIGFAYKMHSEDIDDDGDNDIFVSLFYQKEIVWFENEGNGNFSMPHSIYTGDLYPVAITADDFNGDSKMDVLTGLYPAQITWFENKGPLGIEENTTNLFSIYPNPTSGLLNIKSKSPIAEITIHNNLGQLLFTSEEKNQVDISTLTEGIYFIKIKDENSQSETKKIIKN